MKNQPVENAKGAVELFEGVDALAVMAKASALCSDRPRPMLVDMNRMEGVEH